MANPALDSQSDSRSSTSPPRLTSALQISGGALAILTVVWGFLVIDAPIDSRQGVIQKVLYVHVPLWFAAYAGFALTAASGALYLWRNDERFDRVALAAAEHQNQGKITLAKRYLSRHVRGLAIKNIKASKRVVRGHPGEAFLGVSIQEKVDLIVLTTHGRSGLKRAILGSVADELVRTAGVPFLVIRPR